MSNTQDVRHILVIEDQKSKRIVSLKENTYTIGRDPNSSVILYDRQVSRHHATLLRIADYQNQHCTYRIIDGNLQGKKSTNGLIINNKYTLSHELKHGDIVRFGSGSQASYHIISTSSEVDLLKAGEQTDQLPVPPLPDLDDENPQIDVQPELELKRTVILPKKSERTSSDSRQPELAPQVYSLAEFSPNPIIEVNFSGEITYINPAASIKFPDLQKTQLDHQLLKGLVNENVHQAGTSYVRELEVNEEFFEQHIHYIPEQSVIRSYIFDVTRYKRIENKLQANQERYSFFVEKTTEGIFLVDFYTKEILEANGAGGQLLGYKTDEIIGLSLYQIVALDREVIDGELQQVSENKAHLIDESLYRCKDGTLISVEVKITRTFYHKKPIYCLSIRDISDRKRSEEKVQYQAFHDELTNLPNRSLFQKQLSIGLANAKKNQTLLAVMFLNIDSFKNINNTLGHSLGDQFLKDFAQRLTFCVRTGDTVARWGGDEFTILLPRIKNTEDTVKLSQRIFEDLKQPFVIGGQQLQIKVSIGIAVYPQDGEDEESLLKNADVALARTKKQGRNNYQFYTPAMSSEAALLLRVESALNKALDRREFSLYYQPQVKISTGEVTGMEALLRWEMSEIGSIPPSKFIPMAEKTDLILQINKWVLKTACEQNRAWQDAGLPPIPITINLCCREFQQPNLVEAIARVLEKTGLDPQWVELEFTENTLRQNLKAAGEIFQDCNNLGLRLALDDFGWGFSSIGYLKQFRFRTLKIAQAFIRDLRGSSQENAIISALITLGRGFNLRVIAEGVETPEQLELLKNLQCEQVQGYLFSRPLRAADATKFLTDHTPIREEIN